MYRSFRVLLSFSLFLSLLYLPAYAQSGENGAISGKVFIDDEGNVLPGAVLILLSSRGMSKTVVSDEEGKYRFPALLPGLYSLDVKADGFVPQKQENIRIHVAKTLTVDFQLKIGKLSEKVTVLGRPPLIDFKDSQTGVANLTQELIASIPASSWNDTRDIMNLAPGVAGGSAYGGAEGNANAYNVDGVTISDTQWGESWVMFNFNSVEEAQMMGIGAPAEYDGFTGGAFNIVTKSGGNNLSGGMNFYYQGIDWNSDNSGDHEDLETSPAVKLIDPSVFIGGPLIKDKLWFFADLQLYTDTYQAPGFPKATVTRRPRGLFKLTAQLNEANRIQGFVSFDSDDRDYRAGDAYTDVEASFKYRSPDYTWNANWLSMFSDYTFSEIKLAGFITGSSGEGYGSGPGHGDIVTQRNSVNFRGSFDYDQTRLQVNAAVSHHADDFIAGDHDFKFGVEYGYASNTNAYGYSDGRFYYDYDGENYYMYQWAGYDIEVATNKIAIYAQDIWAVNDRLAINPGLRFSMYRGRLANLDQTVYKTQGFAPRIGVSYDLLGDHSTVLKAHYGRYYDGMKAQFYSSADPSNDDFSIYFWDPDAQEFILDFVDPGGTSTTVDPNIKHPSVDQLSFGLERELFEDVSLQITYLYKVNKNFIARVNTNARYEQVVYNDPITGNSYNVWNQTTDPANNVYMMTNPVAGSYESVKITPERKFHSLQFVLNKRFSNNWLMLASYVYSKATGSFDNDFDSQSAWTSAYDDPNNQINAQGKLTYDPTHVAKLQFSYLLPLKINLGILAEYRSGWRYNRMLRIADLDQGAQNIMAENRGSWRYPAQTRLDIRAEKSFKFGTHNFSIIMDVFNVFNAGTTTYILNNLGPEYGTVIEIMSPRAFRLGVRYSFD